MMLHTMSQTNRDSTKRAFPNKYEYFPKQNF